MTAEERATESVRPTRSIRRFDVFAEYTKQERERKGFPEAEAKSYGVWLAKVVAARRFGAGTDRDAGEGVTGKRRPAESESGFRSLDDELQTDETFEQEIVERMGRDFYIEVFAPAISDALKAGRKYEEIRDSIRSDWKPARRGR
jgi:hypothetical protein